MFIGHYAVGFASKRFAPRTSLGTLIAAALFLDLLWPNFVLMGWEQVRIEPGNTAFTPLNFVSYPISHSLLAAVGWATLFALLYLLATRYRRGAVVIWFGVVSHWVLDFVTHRPDLPLYPGGPLLGLSLWNSPVATVSAENVDVCGRRLDLCAGNQSEGPHRHVGILDFRNRSCGFLRHQYF